MEHKHVQDFYNGWAEALAIEDCVLDLLQSSLENNYDGNEQILIAQDETDGLLIGNYDDIQRHYGKCFTIILESRFGDKPLDILNEITQAIK